MFLRIFTSISDFPWRCSTLFFLIPDSLDPGRTIQIPENGIQIVDPSINDPNQNSFTSLDYTPMFESPYMGLVTMGSDGAWSNGNAISSGTTQLSGCVPGFAAHAQAGVTRDEGLRALAGKA